MSDRRRFALAVVAVLAVALAARTITLYWSPYPATLDGIAYADQARDTLAAGAFPLAEFRADNIGWAGTLAVAAAVFDVRPITLAQPLVAVIGTASCLVGIALVRRLGAATGLSGRATTVAAVLSGFGLAVEGLYLRRTGVPDEEALALLLLPLLVVALDGTLTARRRTRRIAWLGAALPIMIVFPLTHTFSTLMAALSVTGLFVLRIADAPTRYRIGLGGLLVGGFWLYFAAYYEFARRTVLNVPYVGRVTGHPGLFLAWIVVLVVGLVWFRTASPRGRRAAFAGPVAVGFATVLVNTVVPVFPGTVPSPPGLVALLFALLVPVAFATASVPRLAGIDRAAVVLAALLAAPVVHAYFSLSASLTPEFFATVMRTQTFAHLSTLALAALTAGRLVDRGGRPSLGSVRFASPGVRGLAIVVLVAALLVTTPIAFVDLDTFTYPSTTTESEFAVATFAATEVPGAWSSDHVITRIAVHYYGRSGAIRPTAAWLRGGPPPDCPVVSLASWTETGAHFFPAAPATIEPDRYRAWIALEHQVYASGGYDPPVVTVPRTNTTAGC